MDTHDVKLKVAGALTLRQLQVLDVSVAAETVTVDLTGGYCVSLSSDETEWFIEKLRRAVADLLKGNKHETRT